VKKAYEPPLTVYDCPRTDGSHQATSSPWQFGHVGLADEVVGGAHGAQPDVQQGRVVRGEALANEHDCILSCRAHTPKALSAAWPRFPAAPGPTLALAAATVCRRITANGYPPYDSRRGFNSLW